MCFKFEDSKDRCEGVHKTQVKAKALESMHVWLNEESQSQVKAEYEEGGKAKDIERKRQPRATEDVEMTQAKAEYEEGSRMEHIVEVSSVSEAKVFLHHNLYFATNYILLHLSIPRLLGLPMLQSPPPLAA